MTDRTFPTAAEPLDVSEVVGHIATASGLLAHAAQSFSDMSAVFEAIIAAAPTGSLIGRLAQLGINNCESRDCDFTGYTDDYNAHAERYSVALPDHSFRRLHSDSLI